MAVPRTAVRALPCAVGAVTAAKAARADVRQVVAFDDLNVGVVEPAALDGVLDLLDQVGHRVIEAVAVLGHVDEEPDGECASADAWFGLGHCFGSCRAWRP